MGGGGSAATDGFRPKRDLDSIEARDIQGARQANKRSFSTERRPELSTLADVVTGPQHFSIRFTLSDAAGLSLLHSKHARLLRVLAKFCERVLDRECLLGWMGARGVQNVFLRGPAAKKYRAHFAREAFGVSLTIASSAPFTMPRTTGSTFFATSGR